MNTMTKPYKVEHTTRKDRRKSTGEDFTPSTLVNEILDKLPPEVWTNPSKTFLDPTAGNGNFLIEVKRRLLEHGHSEQHILENMIYGADLMPDNCIEMIHRLYGDGVIEKIKPSRTPKGYQAHGLIACFKHNGKLVKHIVCADGLKYNYQFEDAAEEEEKNPPKIKNEVKEISQPIPKPQPKISLLEF
jgi:hypothetical protein